MDNSLFIGYASLMTIYTTEGRGSGSVKKTWKFGDPGHPNHADSKEELLAFCPKPDSPPCLNAECDEMGFVVPHASRGDWMWVKMTYCRRCQDLRNHHGMVLTDLLAIWEGQNRSCYQCLKALPDPRIIISVRRGAGKPI